MADETKPVRLVLDMEFTNGELEIIEDHARVTFAEIAEMLQAGGGKLPYRAVTALTFVALKRVDPTATIADVQAAKPGDYELDLDGGDADPLPKSGEPTA